MATDFLGRMLRDDLPSPNTSPELFDSILTRRVVAFVIDCVIMGAAILIVTLAAEYAVTLGSRARATLGMRATDIVLTPTRETTLDGWMAMIHVVVFWISCSLLTPFIVLIGLFTPRRQLLHDMVVGTLMVRRSPMVRHWQAHTRADSSPS